MQGLFGKEEPLKVLQVGGQSSCVRQNPSLCNPYLLSSSPCLALFARCSSSNSVRSLSSFSLVIMLNTERKRKMPWTKTILFVTLLFSFNTTRLTFFYLNPKSISFPSTIVYTEKHDTSLVHWSPQYFPWSSI